MPRLAVLAAELLCAAATTAPAHASPAQTVLFEAGSVALSDATRDHALDEVQASGATAIRIVVLWRDVAPRPSSTRRPAFDPASPGAYAWGGYGRLADAAAARGLKVVIDLSGPVPRWATEGAVDQVTRPRPAEFRSFVTAAARRFGARVRTWGIWNEPNHPRYLRPQYVHGRNVSGPVYRRLFQAAVAGLGAAGHSRDTVLIGETAPGGDRRASTPAIAFLRSALCLDSRYRPTRRCGRLAASGWAHHPYSNRLGTAYRPPDRDNVTIGVLSRLERALDRAAAAGAIRRGLPVWLTEFGVQSEPDPYLGVSFARQAELRSASERIAWSDHRVRAFSQYLLVDDPDTAGFQSGLVTSEGRRKPAYDEFRVPLTVRRAPGGRVSLWGLVRPARGATHVEVLTSDRGETTARAAATRPTDRSGVWTASLPYATGRTWRVRWTAADGSVLTGPPGRVSAN